MQDGYGIRCALLVGPYHLSIALEYTRIVTIVTIITIVLGFDRHRRAAVAALAPGAAPVVSCCCCCCC